MAKCFITGVDIDIREAFILHVPEAKRALRELRNRISALENLIESLGKRDEVEVESDRYGKTIRRAEYRILSGGIADALSEVCPGRKLFVRLSEWQAARKNLMAHARQFASSQPGVGRNSIRSVPARGGDDDQPALE